MKMLQIKQEMKTNDALSTYESEYTRLFEALYNARRKEEELNENYRTLKVQNEMSIQEYFI